MPRHRAVLNGGGPLPNRDRPSDVSARLPCRGTRTANRVPLTQLCLQCLFEHAAALDEQAEIDRFVRDVHGRIIRIRLTEPAGDLLERPRVRELGGHRVTQRGVPRQATPFRGAGRAPTPAGQRPRPDTGGDRRIAAPPDSRLRGPGASGG